MEEPLYCVSKSMQAGKIPYRFKVLPWRYKGAAAWYFVSLPVDLAEEIRTAYKDLEAGWGRLPVWAEIEGLEWKTAIWFDKKQNTYLLPLKSDIRRKLRMDVEAEQDVVLYL